MICASYAPGNEGSVLSAAAWGSTCNRKEVKTRLFSTFLLWVWKQSSPPRRKFNRPRLLRWVGGRKKRTCPRWPSRREERETFVQFIKCRLGFPLQQMPPRRRSVCERLCTHMFCLWTRDHLHVHAWTPIQLAIGGQFVSRNLQKRRGKQHFFQLNELFTAQRAAQRWLSDRDFFSEIIIIKKKKTWEGYCGQVKEDKRENLDCSKRKVKDRRQMSSISVIKREKKKKISARAKKQLQLQMLTQWLKEI